MKIAYVVPRYGVEVLGGAEQAVRLYAEHLAARPGWEVEVLTTTALDSTTWAHSYPAGDTLEAGVAVRRIRARAGRDADFDALSGSILADPASVSDTDAERWFRSQGPWAPELVDATADSDAHVVAFSPYLYYPTVAGLPRVAERSLLHPAAHDEAPLHLPTFVELFAAARAFLFYSAAERRVVESRFEVASVPSLTLGLGLDPPAVAPDAGSARAAAGLGDRPYLVCVGRVDDGKGTGLLARWFAAYKQRRPGPLALVLVGQVKDRPPAHPDLVLTGRVDEAGKWGLLAGASAFVSPSPNESFGIAPLEAWQAGVPALVNAHCLPIREHVEEASGGLWFDRYAAFEVALDRLLGDTDLARGLAANGRAFVEARYSWPRVVDRYATFLERIFG